MHDRRRGVRVHGPEHQQQHRERRGGVLRPRAASRPRWQPCRRAVRAGRVERRRGAAARVRHLRDEGEEQEQRRTLGLIILRGESVVSITVESKPPAEDKKKASAGGPGVGVPGGRGLPVAPVGAAPAGLAGPARGVGGPGMAQMAPQGRGISAPPQVGRGGPPPGLPCPPQCVGPPSWPKSH